MGIFDRITGNVRANFLEVIDWLDDSRDTLVFRAPTFDQVLMDSSKLVVREGQAAVWVSEGQYSDAFGPGTYDLGTQNTPVLAFLHSLQYAFEYPFKGDVYFMNTRKFSGQKWGTPAPIPVTDPQFGSLQIRAFGLYEYRITDPVLFLREVVGTDGHVTTDEINDQLKRKVLQIFAKVLTENRIPFEQLAGSAYALGEQLKTELSPIFTASYGLEITDFTVDGVTLPDEVQEYYAKRQAMGLVGNMQQFTQFQAADSLDDAARNPGLAGAGVGMGVGFAMGNQMGNVMGGAMDPGQTPPPAPTAGTFHYDGAGGKGQYTAQQIAELVGANRAGAHNVWQAGWPAWKGWDTVPEIAGLVPPAAPGSSAPPPPNAGPPPLPSAGPPPLPAAEQVYHYSDGASQESLPASEVKARVAANPDGNHMVWREGFDGWKSVADVPDLN